MFRRRRPRSGSIKNTVNPLTRLLAMHIQIALPRLTALRSHIAADRKDRRGGLMFKRGVTRLPPSFLPGGLRQGTCQPARSVLVQWFETVQPEVDGMTRGIGVSSTVGSDEARLESELDMRHRAEQERVRLQQRLRLALEANRMCALDYDVVHDRFECSTDPASVSGTTLESLN